MVIPDKTEHREKMQTFSISGNTSPTANLLIENLPVSRREPGRTEFKTYLLMTPDMDKDAAVTRQEGGSDLEMQEEPDKELPEESTSDISDVPAETIGLPFQRQSEPETDMKDIIDISVKRNDPDSLRNFIKRAETDSGQSVRQSSLSAAKAVDNRMDYENRISNENTMRKNSQEGRFFFAPAAMPADNIDTGKSGNLDGQILKELKLPESGVQKSGTPADGEELFTSGIRSGDSQSSILGKPTDNRTINPVRDIKQTFTKNIDGSTPDQHPLPRDLKIPARRSHAQPRSFQANGLVPFASSASPQPPPIQASGAFQGGATTGSKQASLSRATTEVVADISRALNGPVKPAAEDSPDILDTDDSDLPAITPRSLHGGLIRFGDNTYLRAETARSVAAQMSEALVNAHNGKTEISLSPEELGRVRMSLSASDTGISVIITADRPETLDLMRRHINQLNQEFRSLGYQDIEFAFSGGQTNNGPGRHATIPQSHVESVSHGDWESTDPEAPIYTRAKNARGLDLRL